MFEALIISLLVSAAAVHVGYKLAPKLAQQKVRVMLAAGLNKIGLTALAKRMATFPQTSDKACGSGCGGCGADVAPGGAKDAAQEGGAKVVRFHPRVR